MKMPIIVPDGEPVKHLACRLGYFIFQRQLWLETEVQDHDFRLIPRGDSGLQAWIHHDELVQPVKIVWEDQDDLQ